MKPFVNLVIIKLKWQFPVRSHIEVFGAQLDI